MIILIGASASGKTEVAKLLSKKYNIKKVVTHTTRPMRVGEINNVDYHFVSKEEFLNLQAQDYFVETANYNGNFYGTSKPEIGDDKALIVEANGLKAFRALNQKNIITFKLNASEKTRYNRMLERGDLIENIKSRIENDKEKFSDEFVGKVDYTIDTENLTIEEVTDLVYKTYQEALNQL